MTQLYISLEFEKVSLLNVDEKRSFYFTAENTERAEFSIIFMFLCALRVLCGEFGLTILTRYSTEFGNFRLLIFVLTWRT